MEEGPIALGSRLGLVLSGSFQSLSSQSNFVMSLRVHDVKVFEETENLTSSLNRFWDCDSLGIISPKDDVYSSFKIDLT